MPHTLRPPPLSLVTQMLRQKIWRRGSSRTYKCIRPPTHIKKRHTSSRPFYIPGGTCRIGTVKVTCEGTFPSRKDVTSLNLLPLHHLQILLSSLHNQNTNTENQRGKESATHCPAKRRLRSGTSQEILSATGDWHLYKTLQPHFE
jgi:hypothetical protein